MEYNSQRPLLSLPEYGRNVQKMVDFALTVEDDNERNRVAKAIIKVMGQLNPHLRDVEDFTHKLWDHIFIMSDFKLNVESPYPLPSKETFEEKPQRVRYPDGKIKYGHYGRAAQELIKKAAEYEEGPEKKELINLIANMMKRFYLTWNRDTVSDEVILEHIKELSNGKIDLKLEDVVLTSTQDIVQSNVKPRKKRTNPRGGGKGAPRGGTFKSRPKKRF